jgi:hypothetical protein
MFLNCTESSGIEYLYATDLIAGLLYSPRSGSAQSSRTPSYVLSR